MLTNLHADDDETIRDILTTMRTIAVVGASADPRRPSFGVMGYLRRNGYRVIAVNPMLGTDDIEGVPIYPSLTDIPEPVEMVDIFRRSEAVGAVVDEALALHPLPQVIWMQLGVRDDAAAARAMAQGVRVVVNRCPAIEGPRLLGRR